MYFLQSLLKVEVDFRAHQYIQYCLGLFTQKFIFAEKQKPVSPDFEPDLVLNILHLFQHLSIVFKTIY